MYNTVCYSNIILTYICKQYTVVTFIIIVVFVMLFDLNKFGFSNCLQRFHIDFFPLLFAFLQYCYNVYLISNLA